LLLLLLLLVLLQWSESVVKLWLMAEVPLVLLAVILKFLVVLLQLSAAQLQVATSVSVAAMMSTTTLTV